MPITVDHEQRRIRIADITADLVSNHGLEGVTIRRVAAELGYSTTIVTHYFANKRELLMYTQRQAAVHTQKLIGDRYAADHCDLKGCLEALLPVDRHSRRDWKVYFAFWHVATIDPVFARQQRQGITTARRYIQRVLNNMGAQGLLRGSRDTSQLARRLLIFIQGIAIQAIVNPYEWSARKQRAFLTCELPTLLR